MLKNIITVAMAAMIACTPALSANDDKLSLSDEKHLEWFKEAKFGMFVHWGLYTLLEGSYGGRTMPDKSLPQGNSWYAEWIQPRLNVPAEEYRKLSGQFNPVGFDADKWIVEAKNAGMRYFVITSKHHDGFALWDSKVSDFTVMNTPFKRDILKELVAACKKHGLKYGFYYSHWQDWEHPNGALPLWPDITPNKDFEKYWREKCLPQVKELLVNFDPDMLWFDTWGDEKDDITPERRDELIALVRANSNKCLINGRIRFIGPGDHIDFLEMHDNTYPDKILEKPWQTPATMVHSWGWHARDFNWKPSKQMLGYLVSNASKGGNYLLNIGPKPDGTFPVPAIRRLREMGAWLYANGEGVYGTKAIALKPDSDKVILTGSKDGKTIYAGITDGSKEVLLPVPAERVVQAEILETGMPVPFKAEGGKVIFDIPSQALQDGSIVVLKVSLKTE